MPQEAVVVGQRIPRIDGLEKATGRAIYGVDVALPGMLFAKILRSPHAHARIVRIDTHRACALPGVRAVITGEDTPKIKYGFLKMRNPAYADQLPLQVEKVRFIGDEVAAVAAVDEETAEEALDLIEVAYEPLPGVFDPEAAMAAGAPLVHEERGTNVFDRACLEAGDVTAGFREADEIFEGRYSTTPASQVCLETQQSVCVWDASDRLTVYASTQMPFRLREDLASCLGLRETQVRVLRTAVGGGFGKRMEMHAADPICAILARKTGRPVKIVYARDEEFVGTRFRHPMRFGVKLGVKRDGRMTALDMRAVTDSGAYASMAPGVTRVAGGNAITLYRIPHVRFTADVVYTNNPPAGAFRGYGTPQGIFALEQLVDDAARRMNIDPVDLRLKNANRPNSRTVLGQRITSCGQMECIRRAAEVIGLPKKGGGGEGRGIGLAAGINVAGGTRSQRNSDGCGAIAKMEDDGTVLISTGGQEIGTGGSTMMAQIAAEEMGLPVSAVRVGNVDTDGMPWDVGAHAQRNTFVSGNAVRLASRDARQQLVARAADLLEARPEDIEIQQGRVFVRGAPRRSLAVAEVVRQAHYSRTSVIIVGKAWYDPPTELPDPRGHGNRTASLAYSAQAAEVDVDMRTGQVRVLRFVCVQDVGRAINPMDVEGQIEGGIAQGIGWALSEEIMWREGKILNANLLDYRVPTFLDFPRFEIELVETMDPEGPYGAKGAAEIAIVPTAAAIANAIADAIGVRIPDLPFTPERVLRAILEAQR